MCVEACSLTTQKPPLYWLAQMLPLESKARGSQLHGPSVMGDHASWLGLKRSTFEPLSWTNQSCPSGAGRIRPKADWVGILGIAHGVSVPPSQRSSPLPSLAK